MKEAFLHHVWQYQKLISQNLTTVCNQELKIIHPGMLQTQSGPDFFNAQIVLNGQKWAGNIEIHLKSSDWYAHHHDKDDRYDAVILHVVWEHDVDIFRKNETSLPVIELKNIVNPQFVSSYNNLMLPKSWLFCEKDINKVPDFQLNAWLERLFFERLEQKSTIINDLLKTLKSDWEAVLFVLLAKNFGSNTNGALFMQMALSLDFSIVRKEANQDLALEALVFGRLNLLKEEFQENYPKQLKSTWEYQKVKYQIQDFCFPPIQFFKVRPDNFPTLRLAQLATLYQNRKQLFQEIIVSNRSDKVYDVFNFQLNEYWKNHYRFELESPSKSKKISKSFVQNLFINTIIPLKFAYFKQNNSWDQMEQLTTLMQSLDPENNSITQKFNQFGVSNQNAYESQALLYLKNNYCNPQKCLDCAVGHWLLSKSRSEI